MRELARMGILAWMESHKYAAARAAFLAYHAALRRAEDARPYQDASLGRWDALWAIEGAQRAHIEAVEALQALPEIDDPMAALAMEDLESVLLELEQRFTEGDS